MLRKYASLEVLESWRGRDAGRLRKSAHRVAFDYTPRDGYLYVRSRMISSRTNDNHDTFPAGEIEKAWKTFIGKPVFVNHNNANHRRARGVIVAAALHRDRNPDGSPDTWVEGLMEVDAVRFPKLAKAILAGRVNRTSMGVDVDKSTCSACGNVASSPAEYCTHLPSLKGKKIRKRNPRTGKVEERLIHEICAGLNFFENSLLVEEPADPTAYVLGEVDARGLRRAASKSKKRYVSGYSGDPRFEGVSLQQDEDGYFVATHRARSKSYPSPDKIPVSRIEFIRSTGSRVMREAKGPEYPDPSQHPWYKSFPVSAANIVAAYHGTTDDEKSLGDRWYSDAHHIAKTMTGGNAALGAGLLSAYSPLTMWPVNMLNASRAAQGDPPGPGTGATTNHQKAAMRVLSGQHHSEALRYPKTQDFAHLIEHGGDAPGDKEAGRQRVVIDRHAMSVAVGRRLTDDEKDGMPLGTRHYYEHVAGAYRQAAAQLSEHYGREIAPHQVQAATWIRQIRLNQTEDSEHANHGRGRVQLLRNSRERWRSHHTQTYPGGIGEENMHYHGQRKQAYGETRVPPQVDTLRMEECPVCGERDVWSGERCPVCGFIVPPSLFRDPDVSKAQEVRDELDQDGEVVTQGVPGDPTTQPMGSDPDSRDQLMHPDQIAPDGTPGVQGGPGPVPSEENDGLPPEDPEEEEAEGDAEEQQGEEDQAIGGEEETEGQELADEGEEESLDPQGQLACPSCGATFAPDLAAQPGVPCPACQRGALEPAGDPRKEQEDPSDDPSDDQDEDEGEKMAGSKTAAAVRTAQARRIAELTARNEVLEAQLSFLARAAGVDRELGNIRTQVLRRHADLLNPASPVPDPPEQPATESTEQTLAPEAMDDPARPGTTPGSVTHVPAQQTTTAVTPGIEMPTPPATNLVDVTAPVTGTNPSQDGGVPIEQRRIETDVRIDPDPLKAHGPGIGGVGDNGTAFPWLAASKNPPSAEDARAARTYGSIRLARLRIQAGLERGDELAVAERIERNASLTGPMIDREIEVLSSVRPPAPARPMARQATRSAPSLAAVGAASYAPAVAADDLDGAELFF